MTDNTLFCWSDAFALGYPQMDATHQEFVATVNAMFTASDDDLRTALDAFAEHAQRHFAEEADWMTSTGFPAAGCHMDEHDAVLKSVAEVQGLFRDAHPDAVATARRLARELANWFPGHADYLDSALAQWMVKRIHGAVPLVFRRSATSAGQPAVPDERGHTQPEQLRAE
jgi:hemerythrin